MPCLTCRPLVIPLLLALTACTAFAQRDSSIPSSSFEISGQVRSVSGQATVENILIRLESFTGGLVDQIVTDSAGKFRFSRLRRGQYVVSAKIPGFVVVPQQVDISNLIPRMYVLLQLTPEKSEFSRKETGPPDVFDSRVPEKAKKEFEKGRAALVDKNAEKALAHLEKAVSLYPDFFEAQLMLGTTCMDAQQWEQAERALGRAVKIRPETVTVLVSLGEVYRRQKKYAEAERTLQEALRLDDESWQGHFTLGRVFWEMGNLAKAAPQAGRTLQIKPDYAEARLLAGNIFMRAGLPENALVEYEEYLRLAPPEGEFVKQTQELVQKLKRSLAGKKK